MIKSNLIEQVLEKYLSSNEFNGKPLRFLKDEDHNREILATLIQQRLIDLVRGDIHPNPHIKALPVESVEEQLRKLRTEGIGEGCLYPSQDLLAKQNFTDCYLDRPFTEELARGQPQLAFRSFDLRVLEYYRNDPRFEYQVDDVTGSIYLKTEHRDSMSATISDGIELARFGFAYDRDLNRSVALFLRDLSGLKSEQQRFMHAHLLSGDYELHPGFYQSAVLGEWPDRVSIYDAFLHEKRHISEMCTLIGKPSLFKSIETNPRPHGFGILLRPTKKELRDFILLLNLLLVDDLNPKFFKDDIPITETLKQEDGNTRTSRIGTITLLQRWLEKYYKPSTPSDLKVLFKRLRELRDLRAKPAHIIEDNIFDQKFVHEQRKLINDAYDVVRDIRMILENHPKVYDYDVPIFLREGKIWDI